MIFDIKLCQKFAEIIFDLLIVLVESEIWRGISHEISICIRVINCRQIFYQIIAERLLKIILQIVSPIQMRLEFQRIDEKRSNIFEIVSISRNQIFLPIIDDHLRAGATEMIDLIVSIFHISGRMLIPCEQNIFIIIFRREIHLSIFDFQTSRAVIIENFLIFIDVFRDSHADQFNFAMNFFGILNCLFRFWKFAFERMLFRNSINPRAIQFHLSTLTWIVDILNRRKS